MTFLLELTHLVMWLYICLLGCLGVTVCYDLRFPEMYTQLVQTMGAQVLLVPSAFTVPTGKAHWHTLLRGTAGTLVHSRRTVACHTTHVIVVPILSIYVRVCGRF